MALLQFVYYSHALKKTTQLSVLLPENDKAKGEAGRTGMRKYKTLYLLHGLSGDYTDWMRKTSIERYADKYKIAVVMPDVGRSWYTDTAYGAKYLTFITEELPKVCRGYFKGMSDKPEDNIIIGLSMGGYGAFKAALSHPGQYGYCASLSGSLDITREGRNQMPDEWRAIFDFTQKDASELKGTDHDLFALVKKRVAEKAPFPKTYFWCGRDDVCVRKNRELHALFDSLSVPHLYEESEGDHSWKWWDLHIQDALAYLLGKKK